jgi:hypothetical protein
VKLASRVRLGQTTWAKESDAIGSSDQKLNNVVGAVALVNDPKPSSEDVVQICHTFIQKGDASRIPELRYLLLEYGNVRLAEDYLNCGNGEMYEAAR